MKPGVHGSPLVVGIGLLAVVMVLATPGFTPPDVADTDAALVAAKYVGAKKCKSCHKKESVGNQWEKWEASRHARAFETLGSDDAKRMAGEQGVDDPQKADACLRCHVTGFGESKEAFDKRFKQEAGVQCEACHGPGRVHVKARMASAMKDEPVPVAADEIRSTVAEATCRECHNADSPSFQPFCYHKRAGQIRHLNPAKERGEMPECGCGDACACADDCTNGNCAGGDR